ncbi:hypothetical protein [Candidatus Poriferisodalis sp.]|uniref:hypothetical protein n=1 Tax=Candidatus Poriferisodalis sp. TaxID=3101277 RepID=UPI003D0AD2E4
MNDEVVQLMSEDGLDPTDDDLAAVEVIYRAMWEDESPGLHELVARSFRAWAQTQHPHLEVADVEGDSRVEQATGCRVDLTRATRTNGGVTTTTLDLAQHAAQGRSVVTTRVLSGDGAAWVWVDVEAPLAAATPAGLSSSDQRGAPALGEDAGQSRWAQLRATGAESLVSELLDTAQQRGGRPHLGREPLTTSPVPVRDVEHAKAIRNAVLSPDRPVPYLVLAWDLISPNTALGEMTRRAQSAALQVAGLARVFVMPLETLLPFQRVIGGEMDLEPGEARLYLPGEHEPHRHRTLAAEVVRSDPHQAGRWASHLLRLAVVEREPPPLFVRSQAQLGGQRRAPELASGASLRERIAVLESERDDLWGALFETRALRKAVRDERDELSQQILDMQEELELAQRRADDLQGQLIDSQDQMVDWLMQAGENAVSPDADASKKKYQQVTSIRQALQLARAKLVRVEIPPEAEQRISDLDSAIESQSWALSVFDGLLAFEAYANTGADFKDFRDWCRRSKHQRVWFANAKKLALSESEEVMRQPELRKHRMLPVSEQVESGGRIEMQAHLKLSNRSFAPRLYFHDDTRRQGGTGKVHVGYIGPHLPTKRFRT